MADEEFTPEVEAYDINRRIYSTMVWLGVYKLHSTNRHFERLHFAYRIFVVVIVCIVNLQHLIYIYDIFVFSSTLQFEAFVEEISHINFAGKLIAIFFNSSKLDAVHTLIKDPIFAPENKKDEEFIKEFKAKANRIHMAFNVWIVFSLILWILDRLLKRIENPAFKIPSYAPFDTSSWIGFTYSMLWEALAAIWSGFGHYGLDCMVASYYMQATCQLKSIKHKLQHTFDDTEVAVARIDSFTFKDKVDEKYSKRFIYYVQRYGKVSWFIDQVNSALQLGIAVNFMTLSLALCLIVYCLTLVSAFSVQFMFMIAALCVYQAQNFLYCYNGHMVQHESDSVNTAIYFSDWMSVSPKLRKQILIAMCRWHYRLVPRVSSVVPVSLTTFVAITRMAYTIYTIMKTYESKIA